MPELSRPVPLDRIRPEGLSLAVAAEPNECAALALRLRVPGVVRMQCDWTLQAPSRGIVRAHGVLRAVVVRTCVVTLDDFETSVNEAFMVRFVPSGSETPIVDPDQDDEVAYNGDCLDLGEATTEQLALALEPYPHKPGVPVGDTLADASEASGPFDRLRGRVGRH